MSVLRRFEVAELASEVPRSMDCALLKVTENHSMELSADSHLTKVGPCILTALGNQEQPTR